MVCLPISLAAFMSRRPSAIAVTVITATWPIIINAAAGVRAIAQDYRDIVAALRLTQVMFFRMILVPSAAPCIFSELWICVGLSWLAIVTAEMLTGGAGIGCFIWGAWNGSRMTDIVVALVFVGLTGFVRDKLVGWIGCVVPRGTTE